MIPGENPYGWGVSSLPMLRDLDPGNPLALPAVYPAGVTRTFVEETPWRRVMLSVLLAGLSLSLLLVFGRSRPESLLQPERVPVEVTVIIQEEVPQLPPPIVEVAPAPIRKPPVEIVPAPVPKPAPAKIQKPQVRELPVQAPPQVVRTVPVTPPKPAPVQQPQPVEDPLPQPTLMAPRMVEKLVKAPSSLPKRETDMSAQADAVLTVAPTVASYDQAQRTTTSAAKPQQRASFNNDISTEITAQPALRGVAERKPAKASLPSSANVALGRTSSTELNAVNTQLSSVHYESSRPAASMPALAPRGTMANRSSVEAEIGSPQVSNVHTDIRKRATDESVPVSGRTAVTFSGTGSDETLIGPAATVINSAVPTKTSLQVEVASFDFLDAMVSSELDPSVMLSLNRLRTCRDPGAETKLKTRLAAQLSQPAMCRAGGVVFDIRNPESAYSIHIDLYNYEQREFQDRCDALMLAVQSCEARR